VNPGWSSVLPSRPEKHGIDHGHASILLLIPALMLVAAADARAFQVTPDFHYSTSGTAINAYDDAGLLVHSMPWGNNDLRGIAIGPDNTLYVVRSSVQMPVRTRVDVLDATGQHIMYFGSNASSAGNISYGKIAFGAAGNEFYVGTSDGLYVFDQ
jgi:hypothetical protein